MSGSRAALYLEVRCCVNTPALGPGRGTPSEHLPVSQNFPEGQGRLPARGLARAFLPQLTPFITSTSWDCFPINPSTLISWPGRLLAGKPAARWWAPSPAKREPGDQSLLEEDVVSEPS